MLMYVKKSSLGSVYNSEPQVPMYLKDVLETRNTQLELEFKEWQSQLTCKQQEFTRKRLELQSILWIIWILWILRIV